MLYIKKSISSIVMKEKSSFSSKSKNPTSMSALFNIDLEIAVREVKRKKRDTNKKLNYLGKFRFQI